MGSYLTYLSNHFPYFNPCGGEGLIKILNENDEIETNVDSITLRLPKNEIDLSFDDYKDE